MSGEGSRRSGAEHEHVEHSSIGVNRGCARLPHAKDIASGGVFLLQHDAEVSALRAHLRLSESRYGALTIGT